MIADAGASTPAPTDRQLQTVAQRLSRLVLRVGTQNRLESNVLTTPLVQGQFLQPQMTGSPIMSEYSAWIVRTQFEVQNLRRDLRAMRQLYTEFTKQTKDTLGGLQYVRRPKRAGRWLRARYLGHVRISTLYVTLMAVYCSLLELQVSKPRTGSRVCRDHKGRSE